MVSNGQMETVLWSDESKSEILSGNHGRCVQQTEEERNHPAVINGQVKKPASLMVWSCALMETPSMQKIT